jgi:hypothetical protein
MADLIRVESVIFPQVFRRCQIRPIADWLLSSRRPARHPPLELSVTNETSQYAPFYGPRAAYRVP